MLSWVRLTSSAEPIGPSRTRCRICWLRTTELINTGAAVTPLNGLQQLRRIRVGEGAHLEIQAIGW